MKGNREEARKRVFRRRLQMAASRKTAPKRGVERVKEDQRMDIRFAVAAADFAVNMLKECGNEGDNVLISPLSVETALLMAANGAKSEALSEYRKLFGGEMSFEELRNAASAYIRNMPSSEKAKFHLANSVWIEQSLSVKEDFIKDNRDLYQAEVCRIPFNQDAVTAMNRWVEKHTDGMIDRVIEEVDPANMLYLLNALSFDGEWQKIFKTKPAVFTTEEKKAWLAKNTDVCLGSDAFFPFGDNIERAKKSGVAYIAEPGGSIRDDNVIEVCNKYNIAMAFTGIRLFHH